MKKIRPIKNTWYDWLINYIPKPIRKSVGASKDKIVSVFKTNTPKKTMYWRGKKLRKPWTQNIRNRFISEKNIKIKYRIIIDIWTLFETEENKEERKKLEKNENQKEKLIKDRLNLSNKIETCQYNAALAITGAIRGSSKEILYQELGFEYLSSWRCLIKLCFLYNIVRNKSPGCLYKYISPGDRAYLTRNSNNIRQNFCRSKYFTNSFFLYTTKDWNTLSFEIRNSKSYSIIKKFLHNFIKTIPNSVFSFGDIYGIKTTCTLESS